MIYPWARALVGDLHLLAGTLAQVALAAKTLRLPEMLLSWLQRQVSGKPHRCRCASLTVSLYSHFLGCQYEATLTSAMRPNGCQKCPSCFPISVRTGQGKDCRGKTDQLFVEKSRGKSYVENGRVRRSPTCLLGGQQSTVCILHGVNTVPCCVPLGKVRWESQIMPALHRVEN